MAYYDEVNRQTLGIHAAIVVGFAALSGLLRRVFSNL